MPPGWLFGVVWTLLYAMMGIALSIILARGRRTGVGRAVTLFAIQLALNAAWTPVFFGLHSVGGAMLIIVLLWLMLGWTVAAFWSVRDVAGILLVPYWLWVTFATALNAAIWRMN
jgi:tryptophan-rich sensory protein